MKNIRPYLPWTIRIIVAILFLVSALAKLYPSPNFALGTFEVKQLYPLGIPEWIAPYLSRLLIALEFALAFGLLQRHYLKKIVIPATIGLLAVFCIQLSYSILSGAGGNCGCFGELIPMTPLEALIKNIIAIGLLIWLMRIIPKDNPPNNFPLLGLIYTVPALALFMIAPIQKRTSGANSSTVGQVVIIEDEVFEDTTNIVVLDTASIVDAETPIDDEKPDIVEVVEIQKDTSPKKITSKFNKYVPASIKLDEGKKILCLFAPGCEHCMETAKILTRMRKADPNFPKIYIIFMDEGPEDIPAFFTFAGAQYSYQVADVVSFWEIIGMSQDTPGVVYLWNGNVRYFSDGIDANAFNEQAFKKELGKVK